MIARRAALLLLALLAGPAGVDAAEAFKPIVQGEPPPDFSLPDTAGRDVEPRIKER